MQNLINVVFFVIWCMLGIVSSKVDFSEDESPLKWYKYAEERLDRMLNRKLNTNKAKNVILFLGDGMGLSTVTAGRIWKGQLKNRSGEEEVTNMESLDHVALSKVIYF